MSEEEKILNNWFATNSPIIEKLRRNMGFSTEEVLSIIKYSTESKNQQIKDLTELLSFANDIMNECVIKAEMLPLDKHAKFHKLQSEYQQKYPKP